MVDSWQVLMDAGLPLGAVRRPPAGGLDETKVARALAEVTERTTERAEALASAEHECLYAWLRAFRHHWPERFEQALGEGGERALRALAPAIADTDRYLKLRRIAIENLSTLL